MAGAAVERFTVANPDTPPRPVSSVSSGRGEGRRAGGEEHGGHKSGRSEDEGSDGKRAPFDASLSPLVAGLSDDEMDGADGSGSGSDEGSVNIGEAAVGASGSISAAEGGACLLRAFGAPLRACVRARVRACVRAWVLCARAHGCARALRACVRRCVRVQEGELRDRPPPPRADAASAGGSDDCGVVDDESAVAAADPVVEEEAAAALARWGRGGLAALVPPEEITVPAAGGGGGEDSALYGTGAGAARGGGGGSSDGKDWSEPESPLERIIARLSFDGVSDRGVSDAPPHTHTHPHTPRRPPLRTGGRSSRAQPCCAERNVTLRTTGETRVPDVPRTPEAVHEDHTYI